jgi:hypothetical protein
MHDKLTYQGPREVGRIHLLNQDMFNRLIKHLQVVLWIPSSRTRSNFVCRGKVYLEPPCVRLAVLFICSSDRASDHACVSSTQNRSVKTKEPRVKKQNSRR